MNIRDAILKAADQIESSPHTFDFGAASIPEDTCGSPGCALAWIGYFLNAQPVNKKSLFFGTIQACSIYESSLGDIARDMLGMNQISPGGDFDDEFYSRLDEYDMDWDLDAFKCADALRLYADEYHPEEVRAAA